MTADYDTPEAILADALDTIRRQSEIAEHALRRLRN